MIVISTGFKPPGGGETLSESLRSQTLVTWEHRKIDAAQQTPPKSCPENLRSLVADLSPAEIVVWIDLDDYLCDEDALARVEAKHAKGAWVTYGSFRYSDGRPGFAAPYSPAESVRTSAWRATHLKSFRAGLLQRLPLDHLQRDGVWINRAVDMAIMMGCIELAGWDRCVFMPEVMLEYNFASSFEWNASFAELTREKDLDAWVRGCKPLERLETL